MTHDENPETAEFTTAELVARLQSPYPEQWSDVIRALAERTLAAVQEPRSIDAAAIVRNLAHTVGDAARITEHAIDAGELDETHRARWAEIASHLEQAASGLGWIAEGWI